MTWEIQLDDLDRVPLYIGDLAADDQHVEDPETPLDRRDLDGIVERDRPELPHEPDHPGPLGMSSDPRKKLVQLGANQQSRPVDMRYRKGERENSAE